MPAPAPRNGLPNSSRPSASSPPFLQAFAFGKRRLPWLVGLYITAAYWFTASTSFANPAVALARALTNTFSGIRPVDLPGFIVAQLIGAVCALVLTGWLLNAPARSLHPLKAEAKL